MDWLTAKEFCENQRCSRRTLSNWTKSGRVETSQGKGKALYYRLADGAVGIPEKPTTPQPPKKSKREQSAFDDMLAVRERLNVEITNRRELAFRLIDIQRCVSAGLLDAREASCMSATLKAAMAELPHAPPEASLEDMAAELPDDPAELAAMEKRYI